MITTLSPESTFDTVDPGVTYEWIQSLRPELKDAALYRLFRTIEAKPTLVELLCDSFSRNLNKGDDWLEWSNPFKGRVRTYFLHQ
ncbi:MAG: hypothetical protein DSM106950_45065 [Stigonema ocellatum SAG 48.90 = DSM 106950]|nr:hypothetical protein [Stigonema ocellatum SAG 48.90 = DSM 106950]